MAAVSTRTSVIVIVTAPEVISVKIGGALMTLSGVTGTPTARAQKPAETTGVCAMTSATEMVTAPGDKSARVTDASKTLSGATEIQNARGMKSV